MHGGKDKLKGPLLKDEKELKGDLLIRDLWMHGTYSIHDMRVVNTDAISYQYITPDKCMEPLRRIIRRRSNLTPLSNNVIT